MKLVIKNYNNNNSMLFFKSIIFFSVFMFFKKPIKSKINKKLIHFFSQTKSKYTSRGIFKIFSI
jgi:hypothetical protein